MDGAGTPEVWKCCHDVFQEVYQGKCCWIYTVNEEGFRRGVTGWDPELVSKRPVPVAAERVPDLYQRLLKEERGDGLRLHRDEYTGEYRGNIAAHLVDRLIRFDLDVGRLMEQGLRFVGCYKKLAEALLPITDGHLLP